ncbi:hypothetical protein CIJ84_12725 [Neisseria meningitidis]|uniref:PilS cassette n=1 Tax=Neisseria meningitidis TaxID=487 RepID=A0AB37K727_NEIME|nr:hypothetical protein A6J48_11945 [Neisseria meningitidis]RGA47189.1 hypothetical protein CIJ82_09900 [Neisseria meningitidis]RGA57325.1 hypothetical protein CIJ77_10660 [Neisseria meningitidis]RGA59572.1 hypothetical protein CIJ75_10490 [Neisseria meningitidis]RGA71486.1 hypothetical protein CIJ68_10360 [Neisseria meningitidis]
MFLSFGFPDKFLWFPVPDSRFRGNDESIHTETCTTSFLRTYIPSFPQGQKTKIRNLKSRHSRAGGNLGLSVRKLIG